MKLAGSHGSIALVPRRNSGATWPGLLPPAITPAAGRPARCTVTLPGDTGSVGDVAPHRQQASSRIWRVATSPTRVLQAPITQRYTRSVAVHPIRSGVMPTDRVQRRLPQQTQPRAIRPHRPQPSVSDAATRPRNARQCNSAAIKETTHDREAHARHNATHRSTHQLLGHSNTARTAGKIYRHTHTNWPHD